MALRIAQLEAQVAAYQRALSAIAGQLPVTEPVGNLDAARRVAREALRIDHAGSAS
jgi:hypothetical protein